MVKLATRLAALYMAAVALPPWTTLAFADEKGPPPLIEPFPSQMGENDIFGLKSLHYAILPKGNRKLLFVYGGVGEGDSVRFRDALDAARPVDEIVLYSPGGSLSEGLEIGRLIRARKLATRIWRATSCVSACNFMFMGGVVRYVESGASFKVHMFSNGLADRLMQDISTPPQTYQQLLRKFPTVELSDIVTMIQSLFPAFQFNSDKFKAARTSVVQQNRVDTSDARTVSLEAVKSLVADFNKDHPDKPVVDGDVIMKIVMSEDVKLVQMTSAETAANIARFLTEMSLSLKFLTRFAAIHNDQPTDLTRDELREFNVMNTD